MKPLLRILLSIVIVAGVVWVPRFIGDLIWSNGGGENWFFGVGLIVFSYAIYLAMKLIVPKYINWIKGK